MVRKDSVYAVYSEKAQRLELINEDAYKEEDRVTEGKVYINHENKEIRVYNFRKSNLSNEEKVELIYGILEESVLFPKCLFSKNNIDGKLGEYTLVVGAYLLNGDFRDRNKKSPSIITDLLDNTSHYNGEPQCVQYYRRKISDFYNKHKNTLGKKKVKLEFNNKNIIKGYIDYVNVVRLLNTYLKEKGVIFRMGIIKKLFSRKRTIYILPC